MKLDLSKPLSWVLWENAFDEFVQLANNPPVHSVVIKIFPDVAQGILSNSETLNRDTRAAAVKRMADRTLKAGDWELTGDTIKIDKNGNLIDGHHRLMACVESKKPITTHVVFGLSPKVFDVIDSGGAGSRTAADALGISGVKDPKLVAGVINFVRKYDGDYLSGADTGSIKSLTLMPRETLKLFDAEFSGIVDYLQHGRDIAKATSVPPSIITGILYIIGRDSHMNKKRALEFADAWLSDIRTGPNESFKLLYAKCQSLKAQTGNIARGMHGALVIQVFNYWNANLVVTNKALNWKPHLAYPRIYTKASEFIERLKAAEFENTALSAETARVIYALDQLIAEDGIAVARMDEISRVAKLDAVKIRYLIRSAEKSGLVGIVTEPHGRRPGAYAITSAGRKALKSSDFGQVVKS